MSSTLGGIFDELKDKKHGKQPIKHALDSEGRTYAHIFTYPYLHYAERGSERESKLLRYVHLTYDTLTSFDSSG